MRTARPSGAGPERSALGPEPRAGGTDAERWQAQGGRAGFPLACLAAGALMLALPVGVALATSPVHAAAARVQIGVLALGALAVVAVAIWRTGWWVAGLAVLCAVLALVVESVRPFDAGVCGLASLAFLLAARLHRQAQTGPVEIGAWVAGHRPMAVGAVITTPAAVVAASVPGDWPPPVAVAAGLVCALASALLCRAVSR